MREGKLWRAPRMSSAKAAPELDRGWRPVPDKRSPPSPSPTPPLPPKDMLQYLEHVTERGTGSHDKDMRQSKCAP